MPRRQTKIKLTVITLVILIIATAYLFAKPVIEYRRHQSEHAFTTAILYFPSGSRRKTIELFLGQPNSGLPASIMRRYRNECIINPQPEDVLVAYHLEESIVGERDDARRLACILHYQNGQLVSHRQFIWTPDFVLVGP